jgi:hypothetical protein
MIASIVDESMPVAEIQRQSVKQEITVDDVTV